MKKFKLKRVVAAPDHVFRIRRRRMKKKTLGHVHFRRRVITINTRQPEI